MSQQNKTKAKMGRPITRLIDGIPDSPENVARAIMQAPPKAQWDYTRKPESEGEDESDDENEDGEHCL